MLVLDADYHLNAATAAPHVLHAFFLDFLEGFCGHFLALLGANPDLGIAAVVADHPPARAAVVPSLEEGELGWAERAVRRRACEEK